MKFGIIRNVAGNIDALRDADRLFEERGVETRICLGQIVGMYPYVDDCLQMLTDQKYLCLRQAVDEEFASGCRFIGWSKAYLIRAVKFAHSRTTAEAVRLIENLPKSIEIHGVGFEGLTKDQDHLNSSAQAASAFASWTQPVVIHAAEYDPCVWYEDLKHVALQTGHNQLPCEGRLLVSTGGLGSIYDGSVNSGQPAAMIYDDGKRSAEMLRPVCNVRRIFDALRDIGYPPQVLNFLEKQEYPAWRCN